MADQVHLWREFRAPPFQRYACTLEEAPDTESGYRVATADVGVADVTFLHKVHEAMMRPVLVHLAPERPMDGIVDRVGWAHPKEPGHFGEAARQIPGATVRNEGRP